VNSLLLTLTALLILVLSALFAAPLVIDWNDYRPVFETQAAKLLGREVKVGGQVHLVLLPAPELRFDDIKVADQDGRLDRPFLEARSLEAWLNIGALLSGGIEARKIAILDPVLRLDLKPDGSGNWSDVGRRGVGLPFAPKDVMLDSVSVSGGRIEITRDGAPRLALEDIAGEASASSLSGPYKVSATYSVEGRPQELRFSTSEPDAAGLLRIKSALRDIERNTTYVLDGGMSGLGGKPVYDGTIVVRVANAPTDEPEADDTDSASEQPAASGEPAASEVPSPDPAAPKDKTSLLELKGALTATIDHAELPDFELTIPAKGHPQTLKGKLALDFGERFKANCELSGSFVDLDALFATGAEQQSSPAAVLYMLADEALGETAEFGGSTLAVSIQQAGLGGDLIGTLDLALTAKEGALSIERLKAVLPGGNRIEASGLLSRGAFGPIFAGPIKLEGSGLRALTRWAAGDRGMSGQAATSDFVLAANAMVGDGELKLAAATGELSATKFRGDLRFKGGERSLIELNLDSDRLDLRALIGDGAIWRSWLPAAPAQGGAPAATSAKDGAPAPADAQNILVQLRDDDVRATLRIGELLLPNIPPGKLDARFALIRDTLDVQQLDFAAGDAIALNGKGRIEHLSEAPSGRVDFALRAATTDSLRLTSELFGLPESVSQSKHLSSLAPLDIHVGLVAAREGAATNASIELGGKAGGSDVVLVAHAVGEPAKLSEAKIDIDGSVTGDRPQALLVLLFPNLPAERFAAAGGSQGKLTVKLAGVPQTKLIGKAALETAAMKLGFDGQGSVQEEGVAFTGKGSLTSQDASLALALMGLEAPPSAAGVPLAVRADIAKQFASIDFNAVTGTVAGQALDGSAHFDTGGNMVHFTLAANADSVSLPSLLGVLVAWQRTPSTEEMLGAIGAGASEVWPSRGFSLGVIENAEGEIKLTAKQLALGPPFQVAGASLLARVDKAGLTLTDLRGRLFGGAFAASGTLSPLGAGASLKAHAEIKGGKLDEVSKSVVGASLAKGPFDLAFDVAGEGLSPPGLVAGLSGEGSLSLGAGTLQGLTPDPLRRVAVLAANKTIKVDKDQIAAEARTVREKLTKGVYKFAPTKFAFDVKNGTLRLTPATLVSPGGETKINGYVELASLKLDSEWAVSLAGAGSKDVPPVGLVFTGSLNKADEIAPAIDTAAIESYLTMRRMQEDVERLETLDMSGKTPPPPVDADPAAEMPAGAEDAPVEANPSPEPGSGKKPKPTAETEAPNQAQPQALPWAKAAPPSTEALQEPVPDGEQSQSVEPAAAEPETPTAIPVEATAPEAPAPAPVAVPAAMATPGPLEAPAPSDAAPSAVPSDGGPSDAAASPETHPTPTSAEVAPPTRPRSSGRSRRPPPSGVQSPPPEAADAWKKGIGIFGGP
jgi:uncharacterized protein involved in outer membrane biogenesis